MATVLPEVLILGAGVSGLTTAVCLAEIGFAVRVLARELPYDTTSFCVGAIWSPYLVAHPHADAWGAHTMEELVKLDGDPLTGVRMVTGTEAARTPSEPPEWAARVPDFRRCAAGELPDGFVSGWRYTVPVIDMPLYLNYLTRRLAAAGGRIAKGFVTALDIAPITVNCTGYAARELVPDDQVRPVRGQLVVAGNPGVVEFFAEHVEESLDRTSTSTYFLPHGSHVVLGGSTEPGRVDLQPDPAICETIVARCAAVEPRLGDVRITGYRVGIRPTRPTVRVEHARVRGRHLIHNYGHGGAGVSLSWGCAREVAAIVCGLCG